MNVQWQRADRRTDMAKLTDAFRNFANAPKKMYPPHFCWLDNNALQNRSATRHTHTHYVIFEIRDSGWGEILTDGEDSKDGQDGNC